MADIMVNLKAFQPDYGAESSDLALRLKCRAKGLTVNACAHALFFCKLLQATRSPKQKEEKKEDVSAFLQEPKDNQSLNLGIIGGGHIGKQLAKTFLQLGGISEKNIQISTRRPETLSEFHMVGVKCYYNNRQLVCWADVIFLCCLPSHLQQICSEIHDALQDHCIVYSLITGIPLTRLKQLLSFNSILRPQYKFVETDLFDIWLASRTVVDALKDPAVIQATCPCNPIREVVVNREWLAATFYAALNSYTKQGLSYAKTLLLFTEVCFPDDDTYGEDKSPPLLFCENFINPTFASSLEPDDSFPWFDLTTVQRKDSPFSHLLATDKSFQDNIASLYCNMLKVKFSKTKEDSISVSFKKPSLSALLLNPTKPLTWGVAATCKSKVEEASSTDSEDT
ncbi:NADP-dependent oxidoreductase domain-containing protein 1 [Anolis sagrei]|uniref:NADP-dependent oxidoreductase domain-containing protein 1 n=1 Tax=Anolis sagrei TaxID=38937 RepID=UPI00351FC707